jgi:hypothetical protein
MRSLHREVQRVINSCRIARARSHRPRKAIQYRAGPFRNRQSAEGTLEEGAQFFLSESFVDQKLEDFLKERNMDKAEVTGPQLEGLRKALGDREKPGLLMRQLINDAEKFHQKKNKTDETYIGAFKRYIREEITAFEGQNEKTECAACRTRCDR